MEAMLVGLLLKAELPRTEANLEGDAGCAGSAGGLMRVFVSWFPSRAMPGSDLFAGVGSCGVSSLPER